ncbi:MAG: hypothetical protein Q7T93_10985 [Methylobacterium sp.]|uniref:hypothetical protein n=1 Tax=Methylobacterium sp. TaxID=409 RepID=UPI0027288AF5|nr:hypothetical protein [Methylobacterium sp.]MDO9427343.1 hypothetical protein [Methylobacterium sp.]
MRPAASPLALLSLAVSSFAVLDPVSVAAQDGARTRPAPASRPVDPTSEETAAETRRLIRLGQARQQAVDARNTRIWKRWDYAVCIGCGPMPKLLRIVYTTPARVLAGFLAADDDAARGSRPI